MMQKSIMLHGYEYPNALLFNGNKPNLCFLALNSPNICNLHCQWCFNKYLHLVPITVLTLKEKFKLLSASAEYGIKTLVIPGAGEPLMDPDIFEIIKYAKKMQMTTVIYTNLTGGRWKENDTAKILRDFDVSLGIKLDSLNSSYYKAYHEMKSTIFQRYLRNLERVCYEYRDLAFDTVIDNTVCRIYHVFANMVLTFDNITELPDIKNFCTEHELPLSIRPVKPIDWAERDLGLWKQLGNRSGKLEPSEELISIAREFNLASSFSPASTITQHCAVYTFGITVDPDGSIKTCPDAHESKCMFNVRDTNGIKNAWDMLGREKTIKPGFCVVTPKANYIP